MTQVTRRRLLATTAMVGLSGCVRLVVPCKTVTDWAAGDYIVGVEDDGCDAFAVRISENARPWPTKIGMISPDGSAIGRPVPVALGETIVTLHIPWSGRGHLVVLSNDEVLERIPVEVAKD